MITHRRLNELGRYAATGALCVSLNVGIAMALTELLGLHYLVSLLLCSLIVTVVGFFLNRSWTFGKQGGGLAPEFVRYSLATATNIVIGMWACSLLVENLDIPYSFSIAIVAVLFAPTTYVVHRAWTFGLSFFYGK